MKNIRIVDAEQIEKSITQLFLDANVNLPDDVRQSLTAAKQCESIGICKTMLERLEENADLAKQSSMPICQDTGMAIVFIEIGQDVHITGKPLRQAVNDGVARAYEVGFFRKSVVSHPLIRKNSGDNTPAIIHTEITEGDKIKITACPKGFGSENMSALCMFNPSVTIDEIVSFVADTIKNAGANPCPPIIVGVGVGGSFEYCAFLAKKALLRRIGEYNSDEQYASLEKRILEAVNKTGVGVQGLGGCNTALWAAVEGYATHIAGLPVAVNISCHVTRHSEVII